jgi:hypothetical protein
MIEMKDIYQFIQNVLHVCCIICIFIITIYEIKCISKNSNINLILTSEIEGYNFTYICSIINILNTIFLVLVLFDKNNTKIINYAVILFIINLIIGLWTISLYCNLKIIGRFNDIIIIQFNIFLIECSLFGLFVILLSYKYIYDKNDNNTNYVLVAEPIKNTIPIIKDNI